MSELLLAPYCNGDLPANAATQESGSIECVRTGDIDAFDAIMLPAPIAIPTSRVEIAASSGQTVSGAQQ